MSQYVIDEISAHDRIDVYPSCEIVDGGGEARLEWLELRNTVTGETTRRDCGGLFLLLGAEPRCEWLPSAVIRDQHGFVLTGRDVPRSHGSLGFLPRAWPPQYRACSPSEIPALDRQNASQPPAAKDRQS